MTTKDELEVAKQRIAELEDEVAQLRAQIGDDGAAADLRARLAQLGAASVLGAPGEHSELLEQVVQAAMHVLRAHAGCLYMLDENSEELVFEVALGERSAPPPGQRFSLSEGIAGWVAVSGQAIAVADVHEDPQWAKHLEQIMGYVPKTVLAMPLLLRDSVIGVLQLMDKEGGNPFSAKDKATLGLFGQLAAVAIAQSRRMSSLFGLIRTLLVDADQQGDLAPQMAAFVAHTEESAEYRDILKLARLLGEIARQSTAARKLTVQVTEAIVTYLHAHPRLGG
jgi:signal transduction protein with GAF and PtsI domain